MSTTRDCQLLHQGGRAGRWGNLGLWNAHTPDYFSACTALARAVGQAAGLQAGERVLAVACGAGEELRLWRQDFGAADVLGVEADPALVRAAQAVAGDGARVRLGSGSALAALGLADASVDCVLCVDAAYHFRPRAAFLQQAWRLLRPGGRLAYTDLVLDNRSGTAPALLRASARLCGLDGRELLTPELQLQRLRACGYADVHLQRLDAAVLDGFAAFVRRQAQPPWRWPRVALTAALIPPCRKAGLGYAMLSATRPAGVDVAPSMHAATA